MRRVKIANAERSAVTRYAPSIKSITNTGNA